MGMVFWKGTIALYFAATYYYTVCNAQYDLVSQFKEATQSSNHSDTAVASKAVDGNTDGNFWANSCTHTADISYNEWWYLNLGTSTVISRIVIYNRVDCCGQRLIGAVVRVGNTSVSPFTENTQCGSVITSFMESSNPIEIECNLAISGQYVSVYLPGSEPLALCEVQVYKDTEQPTLTCPSDVIVETEMGTATASVDYSGNITASDNSGDIPTILPDPTPTFPANLGIGANPFTFTATDSSGNTGTCTFTITVQDTKEPTLTCPSDETVDADKGSATAWVQYPDTEQPTLTCPSDATTDLGVATASVVYSGTISASDNSGTVPAISPDPTTFPANLGIGANPFTFTATDSSGNTDTCTFTITVKAFRSRLMVRKQKGQSEHDVIRIIPTQSAIRCVAHCMIDPLCVSMHFGMDTCQLNGISGGDDEDDIITDTNMAYYKNTQ